MRSYKDIDKLVNIISPEQLGDYLYNNYKDYAIELADKIDNEDIKNYYKDHINQMYIDLKDK